MGKLFDRKDSVVEEHYTQSFIPMSPDAVQTSPLDLSLKDKPFLYPQRSSSPSDSRARTTHNNSRSIFIEDIPDRPRVITEPKKEWHYRSLKDLQKKHLPYLAGIGPQRTPIRVTVSDMHHEQIYLGISVVTHDEEPHDSKVIVPGKTYVDADYLSHDNNLDCLRFEKCNPTDNFMPDERNIYSEITPTEHQVGYKEVRIHMFNLYQNQYLTKELIVARQLNLCKLAFWFCVRRNDQYIPISKRSYTSIIEEKKMTTRSRVSTQVNYPISMSDPRAQFLIEYDTNLDNTDEDNSF